MLSLRLEKHIPDLIHLDQSGFTQNHSSFDNVRRFFNIIHASETDNSPTIAVFRRRESFRPSRMFLSFDVMNTIIFGHTYIKLVQMLYRCPMAQIQTNNDISPKITLSRSPLLFVLVIEPLAIAIRSHPLIKGKQMGGISHKIVLYADVILSFELICMFKIDFSRKTVT